MVSDDDQVPRTRSRSKAKRTSPAPVLKHPKSKQKHSKKKHKHFSMLRELVLADFLTLGNSSSGVLSIFSSVQFSQTQDPYSVYYASGLLFLALVFDVMDGYFSCFLIPVSRLHKLIVD
jgi:hypothetical protein